MTKIDDVAARLLSETLTQLTAVGATLPDRACVVPGELAWDECDCGLLAVRWTGLSYGSTVTSITPDTDQGCALPFVNLAFNVVLLRCSPGPGQNGEAPSCDKLAETAQILHTDVFALEKAVAVAVSALEDDN